MYYYYDELATLVRTSAHWNSQYENAMNFTAELPILNPRSQPRCILI